MHGVTEPPAGAPAALRASPRLPSAPKSACASFERLGSEYQIAPLGDVPIEVEMALHVLPGLKVATGSIHGSPFRRMRNTIRDGNDDISLIINLQGPQLIAQGKQEVLLDDGEAAFISCADPCAFTHRPPGKLLALRFPRAQFAPLVNGADGRYLQRIPNSAPVLRLLTDYAGMAWNEQVAASPELRHLVVAHIYDLMALAMGATRDAAETAQGRGVRAARLHAIKQDIGRNLGQADLSVAALAVRHACTPRYVQRLFEREGTTFTDFVLAQRLLRAHRMLSDPRLAGRSISAIAFEVGFGDLSYFNRTFRRRYGLTPSDVRAQARDQGAG